MKKTPIQAKFESGDRVAERPKATFIPNLSPEAAERIAKYRSQRYGTVVSSAIKHTVNRNKVKTRAVYVRVLWDGSQTPSEHAQHRLIQESELNTLLDSYVENLF